MTYSISSDEVKILRDLLLRVVDDVQKSILLNDAGWVNVDPSLVRNLCDIGLCNSDERGVRVSPAIVSHSDLQPRLDEEGQYLFSIFQDIMSASELKQILDKIMDQSGPYAFSVGLERMLQNSEFPIAPERALQYGIAPDEWQTQVAAAIPELAIMVAKRFWNVKSWDVVLSRLKTLNLPTPDIKDLESEQFEKVKGVLEWNTVIENMGEEPAKALGLVWYADYLVGIRGIQAPEGFALVQKRAWSIIEKTLDKTSAEIKKEIDDMIEKIDAATREKDQEYSTRPIASWVDILRLP